MRFAFLSLIFIVGFAGRMGAQDINFERDVSSSKVERGSAIQVVVKLSNKTFKEDVKFMELLPSSSEVYDVEATGRISVFQEKRLVVTWGSTPAESTTTVKYKLRASPEIETNSRLTGAIFVKGEVVFQDKGTTLNPRSGIKVISDSN